MESGWDPDIKKYFTRLLNAISVALAWLIAVFTAGIYFKLGWMGNYPLIFTILYYAVAVVTLFFVIRYMKGLWDKGSD